MEEIVKKQIIALIHKEVIPAIGCTEPIAVALASAKAAEVLGAAPERVEVYLSANILKNAMGVGIPGTGMVGLPIAIALGSLIGRSAYGLEVLKDLTPEGLAAGKAMVERKCISIALKENVDKLYIEIVSHHGDDQSRVVISHAHTHFSYIGRNGETLLSEEATGGKESAEEKDIALNFNLVCDFAMQMPLDEIRFILETAKLLWPHGEQDLHGRAGPPLLGRLGLYPYVGDYGCRLRRSYGWRHDPRYEQLGQWQPGYCGNASGGVVCHGYEEQRGAADSCADVEPLDGDLREAESGPTVGIVWLRGGLDGRQLRHYLLDGWRSQAVELCD